MGRGFGGGMPGNMQAIMKQAQKMQKNVEKAQEKAKEIEREGSAGGEAVKAVANGENKIVSVEIQEEVVKSGDTEMLQDLILAACNDALSKAQDAVKKEMDAATGGMNLPGMS
ncbi:UNVERIFIED_CONTAM: hypothetical protein GTU68_019879 [Idotea baltica]|nr:hypothetical protein [Idotea baltica]